MTRNLRRAGYAVAILGGALALVPAMADSFTLPKLLALSVGGLLLWLGAAGAPARATDLDRPLAAFWLAMLASAAVSVDRPASLLGMYPQSFYGVLPLGLCAALYHAVASESEESEVDFVLAALLVASIPLALYGLSQRFAADFFMTRALPDNRIVSFVGNPVMLAACLSLLLPLSVHWALEKDEALGWTACGLMTAALLLTWARAAWVCAACAVGGYLWLTGRWKMKRNQALGLAASVPVAALVLQFGLNRWQSDALRLETLKSAAAAFGRHPLLGYGPDTFMIAFRPFKTDRYLELSKISRFVQYSAHDDLVQAAVTLGLAGLAAYAWLCFALGVRLKRELAKPVVDGRAAALAVGLLGLFVQAKLNPIPPTALAAAALFAGILCRGERPLRPAAGRTLAIVLALLCAGSAWTYARLARADRAYRDGQNLILAAGAVADPTFMKGVASLKRATELAPETLEYLSERLDVIFGVSAVTPPAQGAQLIDKTLQLTEEATLRHPFNSTAFELRATALELSAGRFGSNRMPDALAAAKRASELDPSSLFALRRRLEISRKLGDQKEFDLATAEYQRVIRLVHEDPVWVPLLK